ncbi:MAG: hypothetical protein ACTSPV_15810 [Candidatus Hodarchaeales archaeon]
MSEEKTVYFLGAGASNASIFQLPTMNGFFREDDLAQKEFSELRKFIQTHFPGTTTEKVNLENVITYIDLSLDRFGSFGKPASGYLHDCKVQFNQYIITRLDYEQLYHEICCSRFKKILQGLKKNDTIVTLNYDLVIENTLNCISKEKEKDGKAEHPLYNAMINLLIQCTIYDFAILRQDWESGFYLKLHGSIDWYYCPYRNCRNHTTITILEKSKRNSPHFCSSCGSLLETVIVPPTMNKVFDKYPKLGVMWSLARLELTSSTSVVFIGVSFAPSDYYLSWLIKSSFLETNNREKSVVVIDKCKSASRRIEELVGVKPDYYDSLDSYISSRF